MKRLAWIGPWHEQSAIARFGGYVTDALARLGVTTTVIRSETGEMAAKPALAPPPGGQVLTAFMEDPLAFDGIIVNIGDHYGNHGAALPVLERTPALVILHDGFLCNLSGAWAAELGEWGRLRQLVHDLYGAESWPANEPFHGPLTELVSRRPMTEWIAGLSVGVVTHARLWEDRVRASCPGPVLIRPLAYPGETAPQRRGPSGGSWVIGALGHANPNRCLDQVLMALAREANRGRTWRLRILGPIEPAERERLEGIASQLGVSVPECAGWLPDEQLRDEIARLDVIACLRNPVLEAGSASLVTALRSGRPVLVSRHGVYADIPAEFVLACRPGHEAEDAAAHLASIAENPAKAFAKAQEARRWADQAFSADAYARDLLAMIEAANAVWPIVAACRIFGAGLARLGADPEAPEVGRLAAKLADCFALPKGSRR